MIRIVSVHHGKMVTFPDGEPGWNMFMCNADIVVDKVDGTHVLIPIDRCRMFFTPEADALHMPTGDGCLMYAQDGALGMEPVFLVFGENLGGQGIRVCSACHGSGCGFCSERGWILSSE